MHFIRYQPRPAVWPSPLGLPLLESERRSDFVRGMDERDCHTVVTIIDAQLRSRGLCYCHAGSRLWLACEERVISDIISLGLDLWEIAAQIEEARWENAA